MSENPFYHDPPPGTEDEYNPWYLPGWTAQNNLAWPFSAEDETPPPYPEDVTQVTVIAQYMDGEGYPMPGSVLIRPDRIYSSVTTGDVIYPSTRRAKLEAGKLEIVLPASNDPDVAEVFYYSVWEVIPGGRKYMISVPQDAVGPVMLHTLIVQDVPYVRIPVPRRYGNYRGMRTGF